MIFAYLFDPATTSLPAWALSDAAKAWVLGFMLGALVRLTRSAIHWFKRAGAESAGD